MGDQFSLKEVAQVLLDPRRNSLCVTAIFILGYYVKPNDWLLGLAIVPMFTLAPYYLLKYRNESRGGQYAPILILNGISFMIFICSIIGIALKVFFRI